MQKTCRTGNYSFLNSCFVVLYFRYKFLEVAQHDGRYQVYVEHRLALGFMPLAFLKIRDTEEICCSVFSVFDTSYSPFGVCCCMTGESINGHPSFQLHLEMTVA